MDCPSLCTIIFWLNAREDLQVLILQFVSNNKGLFNFIIKQLQNNSIFDYIKISSQFLFVSHWTQDGGSLFPFWLIQYLPIINIEQCTIIIVAATK